MSENKDADKEILSSMVDSNHIDIKKILQASENSQQISIKNYILSIDEGAKTDVDLAKQILNDGITKVYGASGTSGFTNLKGMEHEYIYKKRGQRKNFSDEWRQYFEIR